MMRRFSKNEVSKNKKKKIKKKLWDKNEDDGRGEYSAHSVPCHAIYTLPPYDHKYENVVSYKK